MPHHFCDGASIIVGKTFRDLIQPLPLQRQEPQP
jgi:hypothetical protein